jgi:protein ImuA
MLAPAAPPTPDASADFPVIRTRAAVLEELRRLLPRLENSRPAAALPFGLPAIDRHLPQGGLSCAAMHEIVPEESASAAAFGFVVALLSIILPRKAAGADEKTHPIFFVLPTYGLREHGRLYGHGLRAFGLDPAQVILVETTHRKDTLWAMEEALRSGAPAAVAGMIEKLDLKTSQRLHLAATDAGLPLFLLRPAQMLEASAAATRWRVAPAVAARDRFGLIARARWHLLLERCRNGRAGEWVVEYDHVAHRFSLGAALADPALPRSASEKTFARSY